MAGNNFTYDNGRPGEDTVQSRLDRAFATNDRIIILALSSNYVGAGMV